MTECKYLVTVEKYGRPEKLLDVRAFATEPGG